MERYRHQGTVLDILPFTSLTVHKTSLLQELMLLLLLLSLSYVASSLVTPKVTWPRDKFLTKEPHPTNGSTAICWIRTAALEFAAQ